MIINKPPMIVLSNDDSGLWHDEKYKLFHMPKVIFQIQLTLRSVLDQYGIFTFFPRLISP